MQDFWNAGAKGLVSPWVDRGNLATRSTLELLNYGAGVASAPKWAIVGAAMARATWTSPLLLLTIWLGYAQPDVAGHVHDYGTKFLVAAGLLNLLGMVDAFEIATRRKD